MATLLSRSRSGGLSMAFDSFDTLKYSIIVAYTLRQYSV